MIAKHVKGSSPGTIVCLHGNSSSAKAFTALIDSTDVTYNVVTIDLPGHGANQDEHFTLEDFKLKNMLQSVLQSIEGIEGEIILVGNSLGGHIAIEIANQIPSLRGLVISGCPPVKKPINFDEAFVPIKELEMFLTQNPSLQVVTSTFNKVIQNKGKVQGMIEDFKNTDPRVRTALAEDLAQDNWSDQYKIFKNLACPIYILIGRHDRSISETYLRNIANETNSTCEIIDFEKSGHYPMLDEPEKFITTLGGIASKILNV